MNHKMKAVVVPSDRKCEACGLDCCPVFWPRDVNSFSQIWQVLATIIPSKVSFAYVNKKYCTIEEDSWFVCVGETKRKKIRFTYVK